MGATSGGTGDFVACGVCSGSPWFVVVAFVLGSWYCVLCGLLVGSFCVTNGGGLTTYSTSATVAATTSVVLHSSMPVSRCVVMCCDTSEVCRCEELVGLASEESYESVRNVRVRCVLRWSFVLRACAGFAGGSFAGW